MDSFPISELSHLYWLQRSTFSLQISGLMVYACSSLKSCQRTEVHEYCLFPQQSNVFLASHQLRKSIPSICVCTGLRWTGPDHNQSIKVIVTHRWCILVLEKLFKGFISLAVLMWLGFCGNPSRLGCFWNGGRCGWSCVETSNPFCKTREFCKGLLTSTSLQLSHWPQSQC